MFCSRAATEFDSALKVKWTHYYKLVGGSQMKLLFAAVVLFSAPAFAHDFTCSMNTPQGLLSTSISSWPNGEVAQARPTICSGNLCEKTAPISILSEYLVCGLGMNVKQDCKTTVLGSDAKTFSMDI